MTARDFGSIAPKGYLFGPDTSASEEWYTPRCIVTALLDFWEEIDLDPCSNSTTDPRIPARQHFTLAEDGLAQDWHGRVYMNPPYGRGIGPWIQKLEREIAAGRTTEAVSLVPARTDTRWWAGLSTHAICLVEGRLAFSDHPVPAPFPSAVTYCGDDVDGFIASFKHLGRTYVQA